MLRRVCLSHRYILSSVKRLTVGNAHHSSTTDSDLTTTTTTTNNTTTQVKSYDPTTYSLSFDQAEERSILSTLNAATLNHLVSIGVGKRPAGRVMKYRERIGNFSNVSQLLDIDGLGIKATEDLCRCVLRFGSVRVSEEGVEEVFINPNRLVKPRLKEQIVRNIECFVALQVTAGFLSWVLCTTDGRIHSLATHTLLTPNTRFDPLKIQDKLVSVIQEMPEVDCYVWEDRAGHSHLAKAPLGTVIVALQLAQIKGMLTVLLGGGKERAEEKRNHLLFLKDSVVARLFRLKIGSDRLSCLGLADKLVAGEQVADWLQPVDIDSSVRQDYFSQGAADRRYLAGALLVAVAFQEVLIWRNVAALRLLSQ